MKTESTLPRWEHPSDYGGFSPDGDFMVCGQSRDSSALERSNYECIMRDLEELAETLPEPPENPDIESGDMPWVYDFRAGHWAVGWVEECLIRQDAPEELIRMAEEIQSALDDYPVYSEEHFSDLEWKEAENFWESLSIADRVDIIQNHGDGVSIFAARSDCIPQDYAGRIFEYLVAP